MEFDFTEELKNKISDNILSVKESIEDAERTAGREKGSVTLIGVTKVFPVEYAEAAAMSGLKDLGENRVQELVPKIERFSSLGRSRKDQSVTMLLRVFFCRQTYRERRANTDSHLTN